MNHSRKSAGSSEYLPEADFQSLLSLVSTGRAEFSCGSRGMFLLLGYYLGLRVAEACALQWSDVDFENRTININKQLVYSGLRLADFFIKDNTKTEKSTAILPIPEPLLNSLKEWREYNPYPLVLCMEDGRFMDPKYAGRTIKSKARRLGLYFHPHMLRHTFVTNLVLSGADLKTVSELARHKSASTSLQVYTETSDLRKAEAIARTFEDSSPHLLA